MLSPRSCFNMLRVDLAQVRILFGAASGRCNWSSWTETTF